MGRDPQTLSLAEFQPPLFVMDCRHCQRRADVNVVAYRTKEPSLTLIELARRIAAWHSGNGPCALAQIDGGRACGVRALEPSVEQWAYLDHARRGRWIGRLHCGRHHSGLKAAKPCREVTVLELDNLVALLGWNFPLEKLARRLTCPWCGCELVYVEWHVPAPPPTPADAQRSAPVLQLRRAASSRGLGVVKR